METAAPYSLVLGQRRITACMTFAGTRVTTIDKNFTNICLPISRLPNLTSSGYSTFITPDLSRAQSAKWLPADVLVVL